MKKNLTQLVALALSIFVAGGPTAVYAQERAALPNLSAPQAIAINVAATAALNVNAAVPTALSAPAAPSQEQLPAALAQIPAPALIAAPHASQPRSAIARLKQTVFAKSVS